VYFMLSHRLKGKSSLRRRQGFHSTPSNYSSFVVAPHRSPIWYNLHSYIIYQRGRKFEERAYISLTSIRFWRFMPKGEKVLAQSKRTAPPPISKICSLSICIKEIFQLISYFWYSFKLVWPLSKFISKTLLNTKRRIS
jgi:hypothetical protein